MSQAQEFWTEKRINRLERVLLKHRGDATVEAFLNRLAQRETIDQKRQLIAEELVPTLQVTNGVKIWEGREIPMRVVLRDVVQAFLREEGITENVPTNEPDTPEEAAERERLARLFSQGKPAAEIVIEDRGPR